MNKKLKELESDFKRAVRKYFNVVSNEDARFESLRQRLENLERSQATPSASAQGLIRGSQAERDIFSSPFNFLLVVCFALLIAGLLVFRGDKELSNYLLYVLPVIAAFVAGAGLLSEKGETLILFGWDSKRRRDLFFYQASILVLMLAVGIFVREAGKARAMVLAFLGFPGLVCAIWFFGLRLRKLKRLSREDGGNKKRGPFIFACILLALSAIGAAVWARMLWTDGVYWIELFIRKISVM